MGAFADLRAALVTALNTVPEVAAGDWAVHATPVDAVSPPAYVLVSADDPDWATDATYCVVDVTTTVLCIAARIDPDPGIETLEMMVEYAFAVLPGARRRASAAAPFEVGGLTYQAARLTVHQQTTIGE